MCGNFKGINAGWLPVWLGFLCLLGGGPGAAYGQLIAPGKLISAHQALEGLTNCTSCHQFGKRGVRNAKCLDCHTPLQRRISQDRGFHATVATQNCGTCHKDHFGPAFDAVRLDTAQFTHDRDAGFALLGAHQTVACQDCHRPAYITDTEVRRRKAEHGTLDRTLLGLSTQCTSCHAQDGVHGTQFDGQDCQTCHTETTWTTAPGFAHTQARFALTGRHRSVSCDGCHKPLPNVQPPQVQYTGLSFATCAGCHADPHQGALGADCEACHTPADWQRFTQFPAARFDHDQTGFTLLGSHARVSCAACHTPAAQENAQLRMTFAPTPRSVTFPRPLVENCTSCHVDYHAGAFADAPQGADCARCHGPDAWTPATFDLARHNLESRFPLTGGHQATPCGACHRSEKGDTFVIHPANQSCAACHTADNPHGTEFADPQGETDCQACHTTVGWGIGAAFDHTRTRFPLAGRHRTTACAACHTPEAVPRFSGRTTSCAGCHTADNPHQDQFAGTDCDTCHDTTAFLLAAFDHGTTQFPLEGGHQNVACRSCHAEENAPGQPPVIRYKPLDRTCQGCHSTRR